MNARQRKFAEHFAASGNATAAAKAAGYSDKTARSQGQRLLTKVDVLAYIQQLQNADTGHRVASMVQIKTFWSDILKDEKNPLRDRLKASELLARASGAFVIVKRVDNEETDPFDWKMDL